MTKYKPIFCLDFDGVVHHYTTPFESPTIIPDPPVEGALAFMSLLLANDYDVQIYSVRSHERGGIRAMKDWLKKHAGAMWYPSPGQPGLEDVKFPQRKPAMQLALDDRVLLFDGSFPDIEFIKNFKPWNRK
jgi:hypothetical protein